MTVQAGELVFGEKYTYSCLSGYEPVNIGENMITECTADGTFTLASAPACAGT